MFAQPVEQSLAGARTILLAGVGGGYDFLCALPLLLQLEKNGKTVHLANLTFSRLEEATGVVRHTPSLWEVNAHSEGGEYFPEKHLCQWFKDRLQRDLTIWCFTATGAVPYAAAYTALVEKLQVDAIVLIDGGVDSLLRGDEHSLSTPLWDALSLQAASQTNVECKLLVTTAFGAERWDKISHAQAFHRIADLTAPGAFQGVWSLLPQTEEGKYFMEASRYIMHKQSGVRPSTVISCMLAALSGEFGERPVNSYTETTPLWVSPLLNLYWFFTLDEVVRQKQFLHHLEETHTLTEAAEALRKFSDKQSPSPWENIPI